MFTFTLDRLHRNSTTAPPQVLFHCFAASLNLTTSLQRKSINRCGRCVFFVAPLRQHLWDDVDRVEPGWDWKVKKKINVIVVQWNVVHEISAVAAATKRTLYHVPRFCLFVIPCIVAKVHLTVVLFDIVSPIMLSTLYALSSWYLLYHISTCHCEVKEEYNARMSTKKRKGIFSWTVTDAWNAPLENYVI